MGSIVIAIECTHVHNSCTIQTPFRTSSLPWENSTWGEEKDSYSSMPLPTREASRKWESSKKWSIELETMSQSPWWLLETNQTLRARDRSVRPREMPWQRSLGALSMRPQLLWGIMWMRSIMILSGAFVRKRMTIISRRIPQQNGIEALANQVDALHSCAASQESLRNVGLLPFSIVSLYVPCTFFFNSHWTVSLTTLLHIHT